MWVRVDAASPRIDRRLWLQPGSVLLACVVLLVLLSILGLAFVSKATDARVSVRQHSTNTQIELLSDAALELATRECVRDLFAQGRYRPESGYVTASAETTGSPALPRTGQPWLASRLPTLPDAAALAVLPRNAPFWRNITSPISADHFESPYCPDGVPVRYTTRQWSLPDAVRLPDGHWYPALHFLDPLSGAASPAVLAADADGDGIADSGLVRLTPGQLDGITYYAAARIIDNSSALNASIAWEPNPVNDVALGLPGDFFPTNLDLRDLVTTSEMEALNAYRTGGATITPVAFADASDIQGRAVGTPRPDFVFASPYEALWMQLGRRLNNPGFADPGRRLQSLGTTDSMVLAHQLCLAIPALYPSIAEQLMPESSGQSARQARALRYSPRDIADWFNEQFRFSADGTNSGPSARPVRAILTARNPVSNFCPSKFNDKGAWQQGARYVFGDMVRQNNRTFVCVRAHVSAPANQPGNVARPSIWVAEPWNTAPTKTSVNTADFQRLWLAFWSVMADDPPPDGAGGAPPTGVAADGTGLRMFRNSLRGPASLSGSQEMLLRAALAAVNTLQLRSCDFCPDTGLGTVISRTIDLPGSSGEPQYSITVYGTDRQPFVTEVFARNDGNPQDDYVAIELFNPYPQPLVLRGWALATYARAVLPIGQPRVRLVALESTVLGSASWTTAPPVIPAGGYLVLASSDVPPPGVIAPPSSGALRIVPDLLRALGQELVLIRPRRGDGTPSRSTDPNDPINAFDEGTADAPNLAERVPVDGYDFTNLSPAGFEAPAEWHYVRPSDAARGKAWHFVYPGPIQRVASAPGPAFLGTRVSAAGDTTDLSGLGRADADVLEPAYREVAVELNGAGFPGPFKSGGSGPNRFPFGAFVRNGDILDVPFIGAYRVRAAQDAHTAGSETFIEVNPVTVDAAFADDDDPDDDVDGSGMPVEQIGHFCPIDGDDLAGADHADDFGSDPLRWRYHWAMRLFDYLTVQCPQDDFLPDADPAASDATVPPATSPTRYPAAAPQPVANVVPGAANAESSNPDQLTEETAPVEGLVNLNTASWRVLAAVPWLPPPATPDRKARWLAENARIARAIVDDRDGRPGSPGHGPFRTLFELNRVKLADGTRLRDVLGNTATSVFGAAQGRLAPYGSASANEIVRGDFISRFLVMTRVSNLVTTRSDSFVVYVLVQGWRDAGAASPTLVAQRRLAALVDRTGVTPLNRSASIVRVPTD